MIYKQPKLLQPTKKQNKIFSNIDKNSNIKMDLYFLGNKKFS